MRIRKWKNDVFRKAVKTDTSVLIIWIGVFVLIYLSLWILMFLLYKEIWSLKWAISIWVIVSLILFLIFCWLKSWSFAEKGNGLKYEKLKKWRKNAFLEKHLNNLNGYNNNNYYQSHELYLNFLRQILYPRIMFTLVLSWWPIMIFILLIGSERSVLIMSLYMWIILLIILILFLALEDYFRIKRIVKSWSTYILRKKVWSYYIYENKIFFY